MEYSPENLLIGAAARATVILVLAWIGLTLLRGRSASLRHLLLTCALFAALLIPLAGLVLPSGVQLSLIPAEWIPVGTDRSDPLGQAPVRPERLLSDPVVAGTTDQVAATRAQADPSRGAPGLSTSPGSAEGAGSASASLRAMGGPLLVGLWILGGLGVFLRLGFSLRAVQRLRRDAVPVGDTRLLEESRAAADRIGIQPPDLRMSGDLRVPLSVGLRRPAVLLPDQAIGWTSDRVRAVLLHEFAHLRRRDLVAHLLARLACGVYWFHPLVWRLARKHRREGERACDDLAITAGVKPSGYASELLALAREAVAQRVPAVALSIANRSDFEGRLLAILEPSRPRRMLGRRWVLSGFGASLAGVILLTSISLGGASPPADFTSDPAQALVRLLEDPAPEVRRAAVHSVGDWFGADAVSLLVEALDDRSRSVREKAVEMLGRLEDPVSLPALEERLVADRSRGVRAAAAHAIGELETAESVVTLAEALSSVRDPKVKKSIIRALGETRRPEAVSVLGPLLDRQDSRFRGGALKALAELGSPEALALVITASRSEDAELRVQAARALGGWSR